MDEFGRIRHWTRGRQSGPWQTARGVKLGIGDDAAVVELGEAADGIAGAKRLLLAVDTMVEDVHFNGTTMRDEDVGYKALAANVSDIAAMGGVPLHALAAVSVPSSYGPERMRRVYDGLYACAERYGVAVIGGDTTSSPERLVVTVTLTGTVEAGRELRRSGARPGDAMFLTGPVGMSAAGLHLLLAAKAAKGRALSEHRGGQPSGSGAPRPGQSSAAEAARSAPGSGRPSGEGAVSGVPRPGQSAAAEAAGSAPGSGQPSGEGAASGAEWQPGAAHSALIAAHRRPVPSVQAGRLLLASGACTSLNDVSDGLASEAWELAEASGLRLVLHERLLPKSGSMGAYGAEAGVSPLEWMLYGGEDYVLLGTVASEAADEVGKAFRREGLPFYIVGATEAGEPGVELVGVREPGGGGLKLAAGGGIRRESGNGEHRERIPKRGYNHFGE